MKNPFNRINIIKLYDFQTHLFSCWAFAFDSRQSRCYLSGDDSHGPSKDASALPIRPGFIYGERKCITGG